RYCKFWSIALISGQLAAEPCIAGPPRSYVKAAVRTYNYAAVPDHILHTAEHYAAEIFRRASIDVTWIDCPVSQKEVEKFPVCAQVMNDPRALTLKILPESMAVGYALP